MNACINKNPEYKKKYTCKLDQSFLTPSSLRVSSLSPNHSRANQSGQMNLYELKDTINKDQLKKAATSQSNKNVFD